MDNIIEVNETRMEEGDEEVFLDFRKDPEGEVVIKLKNLRDRKESVKKYVLKTDEKHMNVLNIFIDTVSRNNFHRKYKKTKEFLKKYFHMEKKEKRVYEFFRLHSIKSYTFPNIFASTYGVKYEHDDEKDLKRIDTYAEERGYITGLASDLCSASEYELKGNYYLLFNDYYVIIK